MTKIFIVVLHQYKEHDPEYELMSRVFLDSAEAVAFAAVLRESFACADCPDYRVEIRPETAGSQGAVLELANLLDHLRRIGM